MNEHSERYADIYAYLTHEYSHTRYVRENGVMVPVEQDHEAYGHDERGYQIAGGPTREY